MKTIITKEYSYKEVRPMGQPCSVIQEFDCQGTKVQFVPMPVEGCHLERVTGDLNINPQELYWVKNLSAYETLQEIERIGMPVKYSMGYYLNKDYAWIEILDPELNDEVKVTK